MAVLIILASGVVLGAVVAAILGYGLAGQVRRLRTALDAAQVDLEPKLRTVLPRTTGRHSA